jgi:YD repeat-containing protein
MMSDVQKYWYNANGNVTRWIAPRGTHISLSYDAENRLTGVSGAATASYAYDGDGQRVKLLCWCFCQVLGGRRKGTSDPNGDAWLTT